MKEKASDAKVKFLGGHVEALVKETISCGVSRGEVIELFLTYWEKEQKKILESKEQLKKKVLWKKHRTMIILRLTASGSGSGFEVYNVSIKNYQNKNGVTILLHTDVYNKLLAKDQGGMLGHVGENPRNSVTIVTPPRFEFSGRMEIWSDEMPESNKGTAKISLKEDW